MTAALVAHPLADLFPLMEGEAFDALVTDIKQNGSHYPIILHEGKILDGRNRYRALRQLGKIANTMPYAGGDPLGFVLSSNLHRRHLTAEQKREVIARVLKARPEQSDRAVGKLAQASPTTVGKVREDLEEAGELSKVDSRTGADGKTRQHPAARVQPAIDVTPQTIEEWAELPEEERQRYCSYRHPGASLNRQEIGEDDNLIDWARWTWNPITGCLHNCPYCYARDISERFRGTPPYPNGFVPTFRADRLSAPLNTSLRDSDDPREGRIFVGSMTDLFGRWVPAEWIEAALQIVREARQWEFLMLTKFPKRMAEFDIPANAWAGTSVDCQARVTAAEAAFADIGGKYHWLSCEPLIEPLRFSHLDRFDLLVIGGASRSRQTPKWIPPFSWLDDLMRQADEAGCAVFLKSNLYRKEHPKQPGYRFAPEAPAVFHYLASAVTPRMTAGLPPPVMTGDAMTIADIVEVASGEPGPGFLLPKRGGGRP